MPNFLDDYETVGDRLEKFWADHPDGRVLTDLIGGGEGVYIVKAMVYRSSLEELPAATGLAREETTQSGVNKTSALENCETSAIGRALANLGYAAKGSRPSREEMQKTAEPKEQTPWEWVWTESAARFDGWTGDQRLAAAKVGMDSLAIGEPANKDEAEALLTHMQGQYETGEFGDQQELGEGYS